MSGLDFLKLCHYYLEGNHSAVTMTSLGVVIKRAHQLAQYSDDNVKAEVAFVTANSRKLEKNYTAPWKPRNLAGYIRQCKNMITNSKKQF